MPPVTYGQFFTDVCQDLGAPDSRANLRAFGVIAIIEGFNGYWNPMNWTLPETFPALNDIGVRIYPNYTVGVRWTAKNLLDNSRWAPLVDALRAGHRTRLPVLKVVAGIYAQWGSFPKFLLVSTTQAAARLAMVMPVGD